MADTKQATAEAELRIPDDLKRLYQMAKQNNAWIRSGFDHISDGGARISMWDLTELIERIARLEGQVDES